MRTIVTGAAGFAGHHLVRELLAAGHSPIATDAAPPSAPAAAGLPEYRQVDLRDATAVRRLVRDCKPDACVHLAAVSYVPDSDRDPSLALSVNITGTLALADALCEEAPRARLLFVSSAQVYGPSADIGGGAPAPVPESAPLRPLSLYAITKVAGEFALLARAAAHGQDVVIVRPGNHTGPGQSPKFVAPSFAAQLLDVAAGRKSTVAVGNLDSVRDFSDVRDVVHAYRLLLEKGRSGTVYNVSGGARVRIGDLLSLLQDVIGTRATIMRDETAWRPTDICNSLDVSRIREDTGWMPHHPLRQTLADLVESLRAEGARQ